MTDEYSSKGGWRSVSHPEDITELAKALAKAQGEIDNVKRDRVNPHFKSPYATLSSVWDTIRDELSKNGLSVVQLPCAAPEGHVGLRTIILHSSGQHIEDTFHMPVKDHANPQAVGSAITYARRYALMAAVGIAPEDDDANTAKGTKRPEQGGPVPTAGVDWDKASKDMLDTANGTKDASVVRGLFAKVRNSQMPEPGKTSLLTALDARIGQLEKK